MISDTLRRILRCPACGSTVGDDDGSFLCTGCSSRYKIDTGIPIMIKPRAMDSTRELSLEKWDEHYNRFDIVKYFADYSALFEADTNRLFEKVIAGVKNGGNVLEIGCGPAASRGFWQEHGFDYTGVDFSIPVLKQAKERADQSVTESLFVCGDILSLPFANDSFDMIWGAGVIEHFRDTAGALATFRRVLKPGGRIVATFPYLSLGALTYRQIWGNIPDCPVLRELAEFVHITLLKKKLMRFGFEYSFSEGRIRAIIRKAGLHLLDFGHFDILTTFEYCQSEKLRSFLRKLEKMRPFWAMAYLIAEKE